ncbi:unnamed protein product, partial [Thlaspi arvense]
VSPLPPAASDITQGNPLGGSPTVPTLPHQPVPFVCLMDLCVLAETLTALVQLPSLWVITSLMRTCQAPLVVFTEIFPIPPLPKWLKVTSLDLKHLYPNNSLSHKQGMSQWYSRAEKEKWLESSRRPPRKAPVRIPESDNSALIEKNKLTLIGRTLERIKEDKCRQDELRATRYTHQKTQQRTFQPRHQEDRIMALKSRHHTSEARRDSYQDNSRHLPEDRDNRHVSSHRLDRSSSRYGDPTTEKSRDSRNQRIPNRDSC